LREPQDLCIDTIENPECAFGIEKVKAFDIYPEVAERFAREMAEVPEKRRSEFNCLCELNNQSRLMEPYRPPEQVPQLDHTHKKVFYNPYTFSSRLSFNAAHRELGVVIRADTAA
jgi:hypothetical protein